MLCPRRQLSLEVPPIPWFEASNEALPPPRNYHWSRDCETPGLETLGFHKLPPGPSRRAGRGGWRFMATRGFRFLNPGFCNLRIGPSRITQLIPQAFSGVTEVKFITPTNPLSIYFGVKDGVIFPKKDKTGWCNFFLGITLWNRQNWFGVFDGVMIILVNSWKTKMGKCNPRSSNGIT